MHLIYILSFSWLGCGRAILPALSINQIVMNMKTLEEILQEYFKCSKPFKKNGKLSVRGSVAYEKLTSLIYDLNGLDCMPLKDANDIVDTLDYIVRSEVY